MKQSLIYISCLLLLASCRDLKDPVFNGIGNVKMGTLGLGKSVVNLDMKYYNPNSVKAKLKSAEGDAWVDSVYLGHFVVDSTIMIPAKSDFIIPVKLSLDMKNFIRNSRTAYEKKEVTVRITGTAKAGRSGFYKNIPLNWTGLQDLSVLLK